MDRGRFPEGWRLADGAELEAGPPVEEPAPSAAWSLEKTSLWASLHLHTRASPAPAGRTAGGGSCPGPRWRPSGRPSALRGAERVGELGQAIPEQPRGAAAREQSEERGGRATGNGAVTGTGAGGACRPHPGYGHPASVARNDSTSPEPGRSPSARSGGGPGGSAGGCSARAAGQ